MISGEEAWEEFKKSMEILNEEFSFDSDIAKSSDEGKMDLVMSKLEELQSTLDVLSNVVPQIMGESTQNANAPPQQAPMDPGAMMAMMGGAGGAGAEGAEGGEDEEGAEEGEDTAPKMASASEPVSEGVLGDSGASEPASDISASESAPAPAESEPTEKAVGMEEGDNKLMVEYQQFVEALKDAARQALDSGRVDLVMALANAQSTINNIWESAVAPSMDQVTGSEVMVKACEAKRAKSRIRMSGIKKGRNEPRVTSSLHRKYHHLKASDDDMREDKTLFHGVGKGKVLGWAGTDNKILSMSPRAYQRIMRIMYTPVKKDLSDPVSVINSTSRGPKDYLTIDNEMEEKLKGLRASADRKAKLAERDALSKAIEGGKSEEEAQKLVANMHLRDNITFDMLKGLIDDTLEQKQEYLDYLVDKGTVTANDAMFFSELLYLKTNLGIINRITRDKDVKTKLSAQVINNTNIPSSQKQDLLSKLNKDNYQFTNDQTDQTRARNGARMGPNKVNASYLPDAGDPSRLPDEKPHEGTEYIKRMPVNPKLKTISLADAALGEFERDREKEIREERRGGPRTTLEIGDIFLKSPELMEALTDTKIRSFHEDPEMVEKVVRDSAGKTTYAGFKPSYSLSHYVNGEDGKKVRVKDPKTGKMVYKKISNEGMIIPDYDAVDGTPNSGVSLRILKEALINREEEVQEMMDQGYTRAQALKWYGPLKNPRTGEPLSDSYSNFSLDYDNSAKADEKNVPTAYGSSAFPYHMQRDDEGNVMYGDDGKPLLLDRSDITDRHGYLLNEKGIQKLRDSGHDLNTKFERDDYEFGPQASRKSRRASGKMMDTLEKILTSPHGLETAIYLSIPPEALQSMTDLDEGQKKQILKIQEKYRGRVDEEGTPINKYNPVTFLQTHPEAAKILQTLYEDSGYESDLSNISDEDYFEAMSMLGAKVLEGYFNENTGISGDNDRRIHWKDKDTFGRYRNVSGVHINQEHPERNGKGKGPVFTMHPEGEAYDEYSIKSSVNQRSANYLLEQLRRFKEQGKEVSHNTMLNVLGHRYVWDEHGHHGPGWYEMTGSAGGNDSTSSSAGQMVFGNMSRGVAVTAGRLANEKRAGLVNEDKAQALEDRKDFVKAMDNEIFKRFAEALIHDKETPGGPYILPDHEGFMKRLGEILHADDKHSTLGPLTDYGKSIARMLAVGEFSRKAENADVSPEEKWYAELFMKEIAGNNLKTNIGHWIMNPRLFEVQQLDNDLNLIHNYRARVLGGNTDSNGVRSETNGETLVTDDSKNDRKIRGTNTQAYNRLMEYDSVFPGFGVPPRLNTRGLHTNEVEVRNIQNGKGAELAESAAERSRKTDDEILNYTNNEAPEVREAFREVYGDDIDKTLHQLLVDIDPGLEYEDEYEGVDENGDTYELTTHQRNMARKRNAQKRMMEDLYFINLHRPDMAEVYGTTYGDDKNRRFKPGQNAQWDAKILASVIKKTDEAFRRNSAELLNNSLGKTFVSIFNNKGRDKNNEAVKFVSDYLKDIGVHVNTLGNFALNTSSETEGRPYGGAAGSGLIDKKPSGITMNRHIDHELGIQEYHKNPLSQYGVKTDEGMVNHLTKVIYPNIGLDTVLDEDDLEDLAYDIQDMFNQKWDKAQVIRQVEKDYGLDRDKAKLLIDSAKAARVGVGLNFSDFIDDSGMTAEEKTDLIKTKDDGKPSKWDKFQMEVASVYSDVADGTLTLEQANKILNEALYDFGKTVGEEHMKVSLPDSVKEYIRTTREREYAEEMGRRKKVAEEKRKESEKSFNGYTRYTHDGKRLVVEEDKGEDPETGEGASTEEEIPKEEIPKEEIPKEEIPKEEIKVEDSGLGVTGEGASTEEEIPKEEIPKVEEEVTTPKTASATPKGLRPFRDLLRAKRGY